MRSSSVSSESPIHYQNSLCRQRTKTALRTNLLWHLMIKCAACSRRSLASYLHHKWSVYFDTIKSLAIEGSHFCSSQIIIRKNPFIRQLWLDYTPADVDLRTQHVRKFLLKTIFHIWRYQNNCVPFKCKQAQVRSHESNPLKHSTIDSIELLTMWLQEIIIYQTPSPNQSN